MSFCGADLVEAAERCAGRAHEEPVGGVAALERIEDLVSDRFSFIDQDSGRRIRLIVEPFDVA
jgi:hypothetical protein